MKPAFQPAIFLSGLRAFWHEHQTGLSIALENVLGSFDQVNLPGTDKEYPNGRRCVPID